MNKQRGYINLDLRPLFFFACVGIIALAIGILAGLYWLWSNVEIIIK